jgi:hypothetical protein
MVAVPAVTPVTSPEAFTAALALLLLHTPPEVVLDNCIVVPATTLVLPVIDETEGFVFTVTADVAEAEQPAALVAVTV